MARSAKPRGVTAEVVTSRWLTRLLRTAKYAPEFLQWAASRRFPNPETNHKVLFQSLSPQEQARIHAQWKGSQAQPRNQGPGLRDTGEETWQGGKIYQADVERDSFVHFTPRSRAKQILESQKLLAKPPHEKFGIEGVQAISLGYGESVPETQTTHIKHDKDDPLVAVVFRTSTQPEHGYSEEVVWGGDVDLRDAQIVSADDALKRLSQNPQRITEDDMVRYGKSSKTATRWMKKFVKRAISEKHVKRLRKKIDVDDLPFDHLFEGKRRLVVDPEDHGGLGVEEPNSAKELLAFMRDTGALVGRDTVDWREGYVKDAKGKTKSKINKAIQKGIRKFVGADSEFHSNMEKVRRGLAKGETPIQRTLGVGRDNIQALTGMGHLFMKGFPTDQIWKELQDYGVPSPDSWKKIKEVADKFAELSSEKRQELMGKHEHEYKALQREYPGQLEESYRQQYWDSRGLFMTHNKAKRGDEAEWLMKHFRGWADRTDEFYGSEDAEPVRKVHELGAKIDPKRFEALQTISEIEKKQQDYDLWRSIGGEGLSIVLSRDPVDVLRMSDHPKAIQAIQSCHSEGGSEFQCAIEEAEEGGLVAYVVKTKDVEGKNLEDDELFEDSSRGVEGIKPFARLRLRRFESDGGSGGIEVALPETTTYGADFPDFVQSMTNWARETQPEFVVGDAGYSKRPSDWRLTGGTYQDNASSELFNNFFERDDSDNYSNEPSEDEYDPYGEGYTLDDSPYYDPDREDEEEGEAEVTEKKVQPWRHTDHMKDFWTWMDKNHPRIRNPNPRGRQPEISPSTLKGYTRGATNYAAQARETVGRYLARYEQERQDYAEARARGDVRASRVASRWFQKPIVKLQTN